MGKGKFGKSNRPFGQMGKSSGQQATWAGALDRLREPEVNPGVPTWNGDPDQFPTFNNDCDWYHGTYSPSHLWRIPFRTLLRVLFRCGKVLATRSVQFCRCQTISVKYNWFND